MIQAMDESDLMLAASDFVRTAWTLAEKAAESGVVPEHDLVEFERAVKAMLNLPPDFEIDIS
tara:strand:- start:1367 stop:1552 length:186 start_codon:yes stop_codon:yes gene_type:complete